MRDTRFFENRGPFTLSALAEKAGARLQREEDGDAEIGDVAPLDSAGSAHISFFSNPKYADALAATDAGACVISPKLAEKAPAACKLLLADDPYRAFTEISRLFYPEAVAAPDTFGAPGTVSDGAHVHPDARLQDNVTVEPGAVIGADVEIGSDTVVGANATIAKGCKIGRQCFIGPQVAITHALIGDRVILHPGVRIGQDGFGFAMGLEGHLKIPQLGRVIIQDDVEIGANTTVDRGAGPDTVIGEGTKIDNLVQIGHNVTTGRHCVIVAQSGISGSAELGNFVALGANCGVVGHIRIGDGAQLAVRSGVNRDVPPGVRWGGAPVKPVRDWMREMRTLEQITQERRGGKKGG